MMAVLYEIYQSGFADSLRSGIVITGGCAQTANLGNFIYDISGYRTRTGYPLNLFSYQGCEGLSDPSATVSLGLLLAAKDEMGNCTQGEIYDGNDEKQDSIGAYEESETKPEGDNDGNPDEPYQDTLFNKDEIEVVPKPKEPKKKKNTFKVIWTKIVEEAQGLYDNVNQDNDE